jgi:4-diphosphocytidyl-2-C-methyl-D-erythritol kinase
VESVFAALDFGDTLYFDTPRRDEGEGLILKTRVRFPGEWSLAPEKNLAYRAASLFRERTGFDTPLRIGLEKRIPWGAGLGGGSSDAAAVLLALNALGKGALSREALLETAAALGSDVPFFLENTRGAALVSGRGERIRPMDLPGGLPVVLVYPGFESNTAEAFRLLDESRAGAPGKDAGEGRYETLAAVLREPPSRWPEAGVLGNDFLPVFLSAGPEEARRAYRAILADFSALGADFSGLTGSGSTCFGIFHQQGAALRAVKILAKRWFFVQYTFSLALSGVAVLQYY